MAERSWDPDPILQLRTKCWSLRTHKCLLLPFAPRRPSRWDGGLLLTLAPPSRLLALIGGAGPTGSDPFAGSCSLFPEQSLSRRL